VETKAVQALPIPTEYEGDRVPHISVVVPVVERFDDLERLYKDFSAEISKVTDDFEFVFIVEPSQFGALASLRRLMAGEARVRLFRFNSSFGEAAALAAGLSRARGEFIFTLASYYQVRPETFRQVYELLNQNKDVVVTRRYPRIDSNFGRFPSFVFHWIASRLSGIAFHDGSCGFRGIRREAARDLTVYGDLHPFLPALANRQGYRVVEINALQHPLDTRAGVRGPGAYASRLLALFTLFFLMKFIKKPLRFFGAVGAATAFAGFSICLYLTVLRLFYGSALADRPLLMLGVLLLLGGVQTVGIGLIGEILVFSHARESKDYQIESIME